MRRLVTLLCIFAFIPLFSTALAQTTEAESSPPPAVDPRVYEIVEAVSADRIEADIRTLAGFGTRNTMSETESDTRGIGAARRNHVAW